MKSAVIIYPASNCDRDAARMLSIVTGNIPDMIWHKDKLEKDYDLVVIPGGFSYGDYLRTGAIAANSPISQSITEYAKKGVPIIGFCNGFQILCEMKLLPGVLLLNEKQHFVSKLQKIYLEKDWFDNDKYIYHDFYIAHKEGRYWCDKDTLKKLKDNGNIVYRYVTNPNGSIENIASISDDKKKVIGMMPHPERTLSKDQGSDDGLIFMETLLNKLS